MKILLAVLGTAGLVWFAIPIFWNVLNIGNACGLAACAALLLFALIYKKLKAHRHIFRAVCGVFLVGAAWAIGLSACMLVGAGATPPESATVVVLGSMVNGTTPSADLWARIDAAEEYLKANPAADCVASGGQGAGESVSEARAIKYALVAAGIAENRIYLEEHSANTKENIKFSREVIAKSGLAPELAIVTDEYHQFRACQVAKRQGAQAYSVCARTPWYIFSSCWARELLAISKFLIFG